MVLYAPASVHLCLFVKLVYMGLSLSPDLFFGACGSASQAVVVPKSAR